MTVRDSLPDLAKQGLTQSEAARKLGVSRQRVSQLTAALGIDFRRSYPKVSARELAAVAKRGLTQTEAARELRISQKRVSSLASRHKVHFAPVWSRPRAPATDLGRALQKARLAARCSYARLGELTGLHRRHIAAIEMGQVRRPTERTLRVLARSLKGHTSYDELARAAWGRDGRAPRADRGAKLKVRKPSKDGSPKAGRGAKTARAVAGTGRARSRRGAPRGR